MKNRLVSHVLTLALFALPLWGSPTLAASAKIETCANPYFPFHQDQRLTYQSKDQQRFLRIIFDPIKSGASVLTESLRTPEAENSEYHSVARGKITCRKGTIVAPGFMGFLPDPGVPFGGMFLKTSGALLPPKLKVGMTWSNEYSQLISTKEPTVGTKTVKNTFVVTKSPSTIRTASGELFGDLARVEVTTVVSVKSKKYPSNNRKEILKSAILFAKGVGPVRLFNHSDFEITTAPDSFVIPTTPTPFSSSPSATIPAALVIIPDVPSDLIVTSTARDAITIEWTVPRLEAGDLYEIRLWRDRSAPMSVSDWPFAYLSWGEPRRRDPGMRQTFRVENLSPNTTYALGLRICHAGTCTNPISVNATTRP